MIATPAECHIITYMKRISLSDLHRQTRRWIREAARHERIVITDRGRPVAVLVPFVPGGRARSLPNRLAMIHRMPKIPVGSERYIWAARDRG